MQLGMIGLGRMGANMARRLLRGGHPCVVFDRSPSVVKELAEKAVGARARHLEETGQAHQLADVPAAVVDRMMLLPLPGLTAAAILTGRPPASKTAETNSLRGPSGAYVIGSNDLDHSLKTLAPGAAPGGPGRCEKGYLHCGPMPALRQDGPNGMNTASWRPTPGVGRLRCPISARIGPRLTPGDALRPRPLPVRPKPATSPKCSAAA